MAESVTFVDGKRDRCPLWLKVETDEIYVMFDNEELQNEFYAEFMKAASMNKSNSFCRGMVAALELFAKHIDGVRLWRVPDSEVE